MSKSFLVFWVYNIINIIFQDLLIPYGVKHTVQQRTGRAQSTVVTLYICDTHLFNAYIAFVIYLCLFVSYCTLINVKHIYLYKGIAGGGDYDEPGNGANTLCLPHNPDPAPSDFPAHFQNNDRAASSFIYGAEYQYTYRNIAVDDDVPCAICSVAHASSVIRYHTCQNDLSNGMVKRICRSLNSISSSVWSSHWRVFVCGSECWISRRRNSTTELRRKFVLSRPSSLWFPPVSTVYVVTTDSLCSLFEIKEFKAHSKLISIIFGLIEKVIFSW